MIRLLVVVALATLLPPGGPGVHARGVDGDFQAVAGEMGSGMPSCCAPAPAAGDALPCAGAGGASCPASAVPTDPSPGVVRGGDAVPAAGTAARYRSPTLPGLFRPPIATRT